MNVYHGEIIRRAKAGQTRDQIADALRLTKGQVAGVIYRDSTVEKRRCRMPPSGRYLRYTGGALEMRIESEWDDIVARFGDEVSVAQIAEYAEVGPGRAIRAIRALHAARALEMRRNNSGQWRIYRAHYAHHAGGESGTCRPVSQDVV